MGYQYCTWKYSIRKIPLVHVEGLEEILTRPIDSPMINTSDWSPIAFGFVRKKKARVTWKREREVIIVAPDIIPILSR